MSNNYQAVYDAVRSRFHQPDIEGIARQCFDISWQMEAIKQEFIISAHVLSRPVFASGAKLSKDGDMWCYLLGEDLQVGLAGLGETPAKAADEFDRQWYGHKERPNDR